jgi:hypothetical protein
MEKGTEAGKEQEKKAILLLDNFFRDKKDIVDLVIMMEGGSKYAPLLMKYCEKGHKLSFFWTHYSYNKGGRRQYMVGAKNPEREMLFFDEDMCTGRSIEEASDFLEHLGYKKDRMNVFLYNGFSFRKRRNPFLDTLGKTLEKRLWVRKENNLFG